VVELKFTKRDAMRAVWTFLFAALGVIVVAKPQSGDEWKVAAVAAVAAGIGAVKNLILRDGSTLKG
jgi:ferric-dicitrate binding protein FerR (iron transport regulator)